MSFTNAQFAKTRPFLFHLTDQNNVPAIARSRILYSASLLMQQSGDSHFLRRKRPEHVIVRIGGTAIKIRDQQPLYAGKASLEENWQFENLIEELNRRIFFWPGNDNGPVDSGVRHFQRYISEDPVVLRIATEDILSINSDTIPMFCKYNSGSPRCSKGLGSPRGPNTFLPCNEANFTPSQVVEITFEKQVTLPTDIYISNSVTGPWRRPT